MMKAWDAKVVADEATATLAAIAELMANAPVEVQHELTKLRGEMDQYRTALRQGGWSPGQCGAIMFDALLKAGHPHGVCVLVAMECLK